MNSQKRNAIKVHHNKKNKKINNDQLETIIRFTRFQIIIATLLLISVCLGMLSPGVVTLGAITFFFLAPISILSIFVEVVAIIIKKRKKFFSVTLYRKTLKKLVTLFSIIGITILLFISNMLLPRYFTILDTFSEEEESLNETIYHVKIIKKDPINGVMTVQLDDDINFDYTCKVDSFAIDGGYGPFCSYHFSDDSRSMGEYIFNKNYSSLQELLIKYQDTLNKDNGINVFKVKNQEKMRLFFSELMQNTDFNKAFTTFKNSDDEKFSNNFDYIYIRNVMCGGERYFGIGLFSWANCMGLE